MSQTSISRDIYTVDAPEVSTFSAKFHYNFYVKDEGINENGTFDNDILNKNGFDKNAKSKQSVSKLPRYVEISFKPPLINSYGMSIDQQSYIKSEEYSKINDTIVSDNLNKIVSEEQFCVNSFLGVSFHDSDLVTKLMLLINSNLDNNKSFYEAFKEYTKNTSITTNNILNDILSTQFEKRFVNFYDKNNKKYHNENHDLINDTSSKTQINTKFLSKLSDISNQNVVNVDVDNFNKLKDLGEKYKDFSYNIKDVNVPFIDITSLDAQHQIDPTIIVGYVIDKIEHLPNGSLKSHDPIVINSYDKNFAIDSEVKYGSKYSYTIKTIALFTLITTDSTTDKSILAKILVSSKPSNRVFVNCVEEVPPPVVSDFNITWDYEKDLPFIHWTMPVNTQRDIKCFQVFRRKTVHESYELIKQLNFNDSELINEFTYHVYENVHNNLNENLQEAMTWMYDKDFDRFKNDSYIYTVCAIDAHGFTSNYCTQFEIKFDHFANKLIKKLISHSGAPKAYPNLYLENDLFVDTIKNTNTNTKKIKIYFMPECYQILSNKGDITTNVVTTDKDSGLYKLQVINLDNQKSELINITLEDFRENTTYDVVKF